jgi:hypothetical protein
VAYSGWVQDALRQLVTRAGTSGHAVEVVAAIKEIDRRLHVYPQLGDPLIDLTHESGQIRIGTVPPLVVRYAVYEDSRLVIVTRPVEVLSGSGI